jgi:carbon starvation protein
MLLQPRDYINGLQLFVGLILLWPCCYFCSPRQILSRRYPTPRCQLAPSSCHCWLTIACGAISGFHGLVATGDIKQVDKEEDVRFVGCHFGALGEGMLALSAILAAKRVLLRLVLIGKRSMVAMALLVLSSMAAPS